MKYETVDVFGYWESYPWHKVVLTVALDDWDGVHDAEDDRIAYYAGKMVPKAGDRIAQHFIVEKVEY